MFVSRAVTGVGCHVERLKIVIMACGFLTFSLSVFEEKSPYRVGRHVLNRLKVDKHGLFESILSVSFFLTLPFGGVKRLTCLWVAVLATTTLGRHVLNVRPKKGVNLGTER
jgi:hypothetical protein